MQLQLGGFRFELPGPEYAERIQTAKRRWVSRARLGRPPASYDLGRDLQTLELRGSIPVLNGHERQALDALHVEAGLSPGAEATPQPLALLQVDGDTATLAGEWDVLEIGATERELRTLDGNTRRDRLPDQAPGAQAVTRLRVAVDSALDELLWRHYGAGVDLSAAVAAVLAANPGLAAHGLVLPAGTEVAIPDTVDAPAREEASLWK